MGHSEKYCGQLFEKPENEIVKPYGVWIRASWRRQAKLIVSKWLRNGDEAFPAMMNEEGTQTQNPVNSGEDTIMKARNLGLNKFGYNGTIIPGITPGPEVNRPIQIKKLMQYG